MPIVKSVFVSPKGLVHDIIGLPVKKVTHSLFSHVAVQFEDFLIEATIKGVHKEAVDKYDKEPILEVISTTVTDEQLGKAKLIAESIIGKFYGLDDVVIGGITEIFDIAYGQKAAELLDWVESLDCSALHTVIFQAMFPDYMQGREPATITPESARQAIYALNQKISSGEEMRSIGSI